MTHRWTDDERRSLRSRWLAGDTAGMIAADMPAVSRSAVMGMVRRTGLTNNTREIAPTTPGKLRGKKEWGHLASAVVRTRMK